MGDIKAGINQPFRRKNRAYLTYLGNGNITPDSICIGGDIAKSGGGNHLIDFIVQV